MWEHEGEWERERRGVKTIDVVGQRENNAIHNRSVAAKPPACFARIPGSSTAILCSSQRLPKTCRKALNVEVNKFPRPAIKPSLCDLEDRSSSPPETPFT